MTMRKGDVEYTTLLKEYIKSQGPNPASGMFGAMAWNTLREKDFENKMRSEGKLEDEDEFIRVRRRNI